MAKIPEKGKEKGKTGTEPLSNLTTLEQICGNDKETYEALSYMFLDPRKVDVSLEQAADNAEKAENEKNTVRAKTWYEIAGRLAVYEGDTKKVVEYYSKAEKISGLKYPILNNPDKAVAKAQEYYKQQLSS
jgi:adenylate kinase family enzyme